MDLKGHLGCDIERIENRVNLGVSDMLVGVADCFVTVELKVVAPGLERLRCDRIKLLSWFGMLPRGRPCFVLVLRAGVRY
jgi:hypothetical protein